MPPMVVVAFLLAIAEVRPRFAFGIWVPGGHASAHDAQ